MVHITMQEAQASLPALIQEMASGSQIEVTDNGVPVATITRHATGPIGPGPVKPRRVLGAQAGSVLDMAPDFDAPLDDFKEYMEYRE